LEQAQVFLQKIAQDTQSQLKFQIEDIVNLALETCFPNEYKFQLQFNIARGKTDAELVFVSQKTGRPIDPMNASGGGVVDITSFALRIASYVLEQGTDNVIILDEPMKFVSKDLQVRVGDILKTLSEKLNLQILMVTHINEMIDIADKVFEVKKNPDGRSVVKVRKN
jgi:DNA repair exonuclease SbcCD ATPase subunit